MPHNAVHLNGTADDQPLEMGVRAAAAALELIFRCFRASALVFIACLVFE
jgi:hypothetical protein